MQYILCMLITYQIPQMLEVLSKFNRDISFAGVKVPLWQSVLWSFCNWDLKTWTLSLHYTSMLLSRDRWDVRATEGNGNVIQLLFIKALWFYPRLLLLSLSDCDNMFEYVEEVTCRRRCYKLFGTRYRERICVRVGPWGVYSSLNCKYYRRCILHGV